MKGGAVREDKSPEKDAMDFRNALQEPRFWAETPAPSFSLEDMVVWICAGVVFKDTDWGSSIVEIVYLLRSNLVGGLLIIWRVFSCLLLVGD